MRRNLLMLSLVFSSIIKFELNLQVFDINEYFSCVVFFQLKFIAKLNVMHTMSYTSC